MTEPDYQTTLSGGCHWSLRLRRGTKMRLTDLEGGANVGMLFYNPDNPLERYNAPDTLKSQHTFKLTKGNCLFSDMGRIFCSIVEDDLGWHETVCGISNAEMVSARWGERDYQKDHNNWHQNGQDAFLVELTKYGLGIKDLAANVNWFSKVVVDDKGQLSLVEDFSSQGKSISLRFEMDTLVILHNCPHPLSKAELYPSKPVEIALGKADPVDESDFCRNFRPENKRGFENNALYYLGRS